VDQNLKKKIQEHKIKHNQKRTKQKQLNESALTTTTTKSQIAETGKIKEGRKGILLPIISTESRKEDQPTTSQKEDPIGTGS